MSYEAKLTLSEWVSERHANCMRLAGIAAERDFSAEAVTDRDGWLEDAEYFAQIKVILKKFSEKIP